MSILLENSNLLDGYRRGETLVFESIFKTYGNEVLTLVRLGFSASSPKSYTVSGVTDYALQCDMVQETFLRAFSQSARSGYDGQSPFRPYLLRITKNLMIDHLRKQKSHKNDIGSQNGGIDLDDILLDNSAFPEENPSEQAHKTRQELATKEFVTQLEPRAKAFFALRYQQGLAQDKVAQQMEISRRQVRSLENLLRRHLKKYLISNNLWP